MTDGFFIMLLDLFSVETLDTRLQAPLDEKKREQIKARAGVPRWRTPEFYFYAVIFIIFVPLMFKIAHDASSSKSPNYHKFEHLLTPSWFGTKVDNSDAQYRGFRDPFPLLVVLIGVHQLARYVSPPWVSRTQFDAMFGTFLLFGLHGFHAVKILLILAVNFWIGAYSSRPRALTWVFGVAVLFANELSGGYPLSKLSPHLAFLESWGGVIPRWEVFFKCTMLRMVSFNIDRLEAVNKVASLGDETNPELQRVSTSHPLTDYNPISYLGYCLYSPLLIAGPILTANDYLAQSKQRLPSIQPARTLRYAIRFVICLLTMEFVLHYTHVVAVQQTRAWEGDTSAEITMIGFFSLIVIWLKLMIPWRFFRLWALIDNIDPPENMVRCMANNYSALAFWRSWHRSYNRWVVRYLYIPLGGSSRPLVNALVVFTFVAIWHDIQLRLFAWGWLVVIFVIPEMVATMLFPQKKWHQKPIYRHLCAVGAVGNIWMMMIANLVGFAVGLDGIKAMLYDMLTTARGLQTAILCSSLLFVGSQVMFEVREREHRAGIDLRC